MGEAGPLRARVLGLDDEDAIRSVDGACVIEADLALRFDRGDDFFAWPRVCFDRHQYVGVESDGELVGFSMVAGFGGAVDGQTVPCFYAGDARVLPTWRGRGALTAMMDCAIEQVWPDAHHGFGIVKVGNRAGEGSAAAAIRQPAFPGAVTAGLDVAVIPVLRRLRAPDGITTRIARDEDAALIAALLREHLAARTFAPLPCAADISRRFARPGLGPSTWILAEQRGRSVGVLAGWDMTPVRAPQVVRYSALGQVLRVLHAATRALVPGMPPLPPPGGSLRVLTTTHVAASDPAVMRALLARAFDRALAEGHHAVTVGFVGVDPLRPAVRGLPRQTVRSSVYRFRRGAPPPVPERPWVDLSFV